MNIKHGILTGLTMGVSTVLGFLLLSPLVNFVVFGAIHGFVPGTVVRAGWSVWLLSWSVTAVLSVLISWYLIGRRIWRKFT